MSDSLSEFELIKRYFDKIGPAGSAEILQGIGDDCALVGISAGESLCLSIDTMVEGVHFPVGCAPDMIAYRAMAAALSDLAAMGARPSHFTLSLTLPEATAPWLAAFSRGLSEMADQYQISLVGGDTTKGALNIALQVHGLLPTGTAMTRSGAKSGDWLAVSGTLGDAGAALSLIELSAPNFNQTVLLDRYYRPNARIDQGLELRGLASSCIDISDGLLADARHLATKSSVSLSINSEDLPLSAALKAECGDKAVSLALSAGDDYELLFTISDQNWQRLIQQYPDNMYTIIGRVESGEGVSVFSGDKQFQITQQGFQHFE